MLVFSILGYDGLIFQPSLSRIITLKTWNKLTCSALSAGGSLLLTIGVYDSLDSPNWQFTLSKLSVYPV